MASTFKAPSSTLWTSLDAARATGGAARGRWYATGVSIDARSVRPGDLFVAICGEKVDGHDFVQDAFAAGAVAAVVHRPVAGVASDSLLVVPDTLTALEDMARAARGRCSAKMVGITGMAGKTATRNMLQAVMSSCGQAHASEQNFNDHWGVPLSLARMHAGTDYGIVEMGMMGEDELIPLSLLTRPHVAVITNCTHAQIERSTEIFSGMDAHGIAILNRDNEQFDILRHEATAQGILHVFTFGYHEKSDARIVECLPASNGQRLSVDVLGEAFTLTLRETSLYAAHNAVATLLVARLLHGRLDRAVAALEEFDHKQGAGHEIMELHDPHNPVALIEGNGRLSSMQAAFKVTALIDPGRGARRIAILGGMLELGNKNDADFMLPLKAENVDLVYTCRSAPGRICDTAANQQTPPRIQLAEIVPDVLAPGDVVMVKGSRGGRFNVVVEALRSFAGKRHIANISG